MRKNTTAIAGQGVRTHWGSNRRTDAPGLAAAVENVQVHKEVVAMATSDSKEGESTSICSVPSVMESPKQVNTLDVQAQVAAESCSSEASQEAAARHAGSQEGSAVGCEEAMESAEGTCCVTMEVTEEVLREEPNPTAAAMAQTVIPDKAAGSTNMATGSTNMAAGSTNMAAGSTNMAAGSTNMAAGSTNMATPLTNKTVCDAAVIANVTGKSSVTEDSLQIVEVKGHKGGEVFGKRLFRQNVSEVGESQTSRRKNEVKIKWVKERGEFPGCRFVARNLMKESLDFTPADVFGLGKRDAPEWEGFSVIPVSRPETKTVTIMFKTVFPPEDVMVWLKSHCTVLSPLTPLYDELGFWIGGWKVQVKLHMNFHVPKHLLNSFFIGFYPGQPRVCFSCGSNRHFAAKCPEEEIGQRMEIVEEGAPTSEVLGSVREVVQPESSAPCSKVVGRAAEKLPKEKGEQRASQPRRGKWRVVGKKTSIKKKDTSPNIVVATGNRFVLPEGKSWGDLAEEEEERLREEEKREKRKAGALGKRNRKRKEGKERGGMGIPRGRH
ncbi:hypothetical protein XELAEV_18008628mg [Xenopus laevis]|uniref:CCHC-type domain-containing protein n=1 Tax=Xenopus laevis TaxID=8355 RepID=A0A974E3R8_XENLA|nr:hypothetical protein XELAEV_18008628mg [Xenopus laevis]